MNEHSIADIGNWARSHAVAVTSACILVAVLGLYLLTQHTAHVLATLPYGLVLLCPLVHLVMHGMHEGHGAHSPHEVQGERPSSQLQLAPHGTGTGGDHDGTTNHDGAARQSRDNA